MIKRFFKRQIVSRLVVYGLILAALAGVVGSGVAESGLIYFPERQIAATPASLGLPFEDIYFTAQDGIKLHGWFVPGKSKLTWLWFHGNGGNISHRLENLLLLRQNLGINLFIFDYRGYGRSQGSPSESGTYLDAEAALAYLHSRKDIDRNQIIYFGQSLGSGVAVEMATRKPPAALILESAFPSIPSVARQRYPYLPVWPFLRTQYDSETKIAGINVPLLMLHGDRDEIIPLEAGQKLFAAAGADKTFYTIRGAGHNDTYLAGGRDYFNAIASFLHRLE